MIEVERTNEKGERVKAYTHKSYLSSEFISQMDNLRKNHKTWIDVACYGSAILTYWALHKFTSLNQLVQNKISFKGKFLIVSGAVGLIDSFLVSVALTNSYRNTHASLLKKEVFPAWFNKERVVNPDRVFFELDDNNHNEPTIWHSAISHSAIERITPDFVVGTAIKPHYPVAEHHHH